MKTYELLYIIPSKYTEKETSDLARQVEAVIKGAEATILESKPLEKRSLAYPVGRSHFGVYGLIKFECEENAIKKIDEKLRLAPEIVRHQILKYVETQKPDLTKIKREKKTIKPASPLRKETLKIEKETKETAKPEPKPEKEKIRLEDLDKKLEELFKE
jgi:ribosomal protein S6